MQTTLLGIGIAVILALVTALVGPYFINWGDYRGFFEARATSAIGLPVRIAGPIDARLLPVPSVTLRDVTVQGPAGEAGVSARELSVAFALGALVRGEWRATEMRLAGPELRLGLDRDGKLDWASLSGRGINPDSISIERLSIEDGSVLLADAAGGYSAALDRFWFTGDLRSLAGPLKGEGGFFLSGERHAYRIVAGRLADAGMRLRLSLDRADRQISGDADGTLRMDAGAPRFDGGLTLARLPGVIMARGRAVNSEPWRLTGRLKASPGAVLFEQVDLQYGPEERGLKLNGAADLKLGPQPRLEAVVSARQIDLDRLVALPEATKRLPLAVVRAAAEAFGDALAPGLSVRVGVGVDSAMIAGMPVQGLRGDLVSHADGWEIESLEFRAPGFAQVRASGRLTLLAQGLAFTGPASVDATDPKALIAWLEGRNNTAPGQVGALRASGDVTLAADRVAIEQLKAELDRKAVSGRVAYAWSSNGGRPKLDAELKAAALDLDAALASLQAALPGVSLDLPAELALSLDLDRATFGGVEARAARAKLKLDDGGLVVEQLTIGDLAGAGVQLGGRLEGPWSAPRGTLVLDLAGARLDGVVQLIAKASPRVAEVLRPAAAQLAPAKLRVSLAVERAPAGPGDVSLARARIEGVAGTVRIAAAADATGVATAWRSAELKLDGRVEADDGAALVRLLKLDRAVATGRGAGALRVSAAGPLGGDLRVETQLTAGGLETTAAGTLRWPESGLASGPVVQAALSVTAADVAPLRALSGRGQPTALAFKGALTLSPERAVFDNLAGTLAGAAFNGRLALELGGPLRLDGQLDVDALDGAALFAALTGMPAAAAAPAAARATSAPAPSIWPTQPFAARLLADAEGKIALRASRATLGSSLEIRQFQALLRFAGNETAIEDVQGTLAGGRLVANLVLPRGPAGTSLDAHIALAGADIGQLLPSRGARAPVSGRVSVQLEAKGSGRTPASVVGALGGAGTISFEGVEFVGLDPKIFEVVTRAVDQGADIDVSRVKVLVENGLGHGRLRIARADGTLALAAGQLRLGGMIAKGNRADLAVAAAIDLAQASLDARLALIGAGGADAPAAGRPEVYVALRGPVASPQRSVDVSAMVGWLTLRSVDLQARRLETLEAERRASETARAAEAARAAERATQGRAASRPAPEAPAAGSPIPASAPATAAPPVAAAPALPAVAPLDPAPSDTASVPPASPPAAAAPATPAASAPPARAPQAAPPSGAATDPSPSAAAPPRRPAQAPAAERAPALPPPVDIKPAPTPRRPAAQNARPSNADVRLRPPAPVQAPPPRSLFDLFGAAR